MTYRHTPAMGEISGFGGGYEKCCQDMLEAGVNWILEHDGFVFEAEGYQGVTGIIYANNEDTQELMNVVVKASESSDGEAEATGAMVHAVMLRLCWISIHGWDKYVTEMTEHAEHERKLLQ